MSQLYALFSLQKDVINDFRNDLQKLATSPNYRKRMTYVLFGTEFGSTL